MRGGREVWALANALRAIGRSAITVGALTLGAGCAPPPELGEGVCGNSAIDEGEECDRFAPEGLQCGPPGSAGECRFVCDFDATTGEPRCPAGSRCGIDDVCRAASELYGAPVAVGPAGDEIVVGDLDGDGHGDVLLARDYELRVLFGDGRGADWVDLRRSFEPLFLPVMVPRSDGTGVERPSTTGSDLVASRYGLLSLRVDGSGADRPFALAELPTLAVPPELEDPRMFSAGCPVDMTSGDLLLFATLPDLPEPLRHVLAFAPDFGMTVVASTLRGASDLAGPVVVEQLDVRAESPCREVVLAYRDHDQVEIFTPFRKIETAEGSTWVHNHCELPYVDCPPEVRRRLEVGAPVARGAWVADVNADGLPDIVVQVVASGCDAAVPCYGLRVSYGLPDGSFHSSPPEEDTIGDDAFGVLGGTRDDDQLLLAMGDLDGNGVPDVVRERNVRIDIGSAIVAENLGNPWAEALVADFNADGAKDVVAVDASSSQAVYFTGRGDGSLTPYFMPTRAPLSQLRVGDFDGDRIEDLLAVARGVVRESDVGDERVNEVSILFGRPAGPPEPPVSIGYSYRELSLSAGKMAADLLLNLSGGRDGADDVLAVGQNEDGSGTLSGFLGRADRELASALGLVELVGQVPLIDIHPFVPRRVVAGRFGPTNAPVGRAQSLSLAVLAAHGRKDELAKDYRLWLTPALGSNFDLGDLTLLPDPIQREGDSATPAVWELGQYEAVDLDADGVDELLAIAPLATDAGRSGYRIAHYGSMPPSEPPGWHWLPDGDVGVLDIPSFRLAGPTLPCRDPYDINAPEPGPDACTDVRFSELGRTALEIPAANGRLRSCPVIDATNAQSGNRIFLLSRVAQEHGPGDEPAVAGTLYEVHVDESLQLSTDSFQPVEGLESTILYDFACLQADPDAEPELAVLRPEGLWIIGGASSVPGGTPVPLGRPGPYYRIDAADFDGDGLDDVVLSGPGETVVLFAVDLLDLQRGAP